MTTITKLMSLLLLSIVVLSSSCQREEVSPGLPEIGQTDGDFVAAYVNGKPFVSQVCETGGFLGGPRKMRAAITIASDMNNIIIYDSLYRIIGFAFFGRDCDGSGFYVKHNLPTIKGRYPIGVVDEVVKTQVVYTKVQSPDVIKLYSYSSITSPNQWLEILSPDTLLTSRGFIDGRAPVSLGSIKDITGRFEGVLVRDEAPFDTIRITQGRYQFKRQ